jgi:tetratricopeptide (TPR) repeat protein
MQTQSRAWLKGIFAALLVFGVVAGAITLCVFFPRPNYSYREALQYDSLKNYAKARQSYQKAVDEGCVPAMYNLALLYANGQGGPQDYTKAAELYQIAADRGNWKAMNNLGLLFEDGKGVSEDLTKARQWYEKAAQGGSVAAMKNLGRLYEHGRGVSQDPVKAKEWYQKAAYKGTTHTDAISVIFGLCIYVLLALLLAFWYLGFWRLASRIKSRRRILSIFVFGIAFIGLFGLLFLLFFNPVGYVLWVFFGLIQLVLLLRRNPPKWISRYLRQRTKS